MVFLDHHLIKIAQEFKGAYFHEMHAFKHGLHARSQEFLGHVSLLLMIEVSAFGTIKVGLAARGGAWGHAPQEDFGQRSDFLFSTN